ncbi:RmlC-like cupin domain-containing protein, partial [Ochromonadaceae sp. CCMP2298]
AEPNPSWFGNKGNEASNPTWTNKNWMKSRFHFSFAEYSNPRNQGFGILRVMNDDLVQPDRGFGAHPHREVEICTYVVQGALTHQDSIGTKETIGRGAIQFMTAGTGVEHSEHNLDKQHPLRFVQIWINTRRRGLSPNYGSMPQGDCAARTNNWAHLVSDTQGDSPTPIRINQDANIYVTEVLPGSGVQFTLREGRQAYMLCVEGAGDVSG